MMNPTGLLLPLLLAAWSLNLTAQEAAVVFQHDLSIGWVSRISDGGYLIREKSTGNIIRMNEDLEQVWSVSFGSEFQNFAAMPDGGVVGVRSVQVWLVDSIQYAIRMVRTNADGQLLFDKLLWFPPLHEYEFPFNPYEPYVDFHRDALTVGPDGGIYLCMGLLSTSSPMLLKLTPDGDPDWMVAMEFMHSINSAVEPTLDGGCYFATTLSDDDGELNVYRISGDGTLDWEKTYFRHNAYYPGPLFIRSGINGNVVINAVDQLNPLWMEVTPSGELLNYKVTAETPPIPPTDWGPGAIGFGQLSNGVWVQLQADNGSRVSLFAEDGTWLHTWRIPKTEVAGWDNRIVWRGLGVLDNGFTVQGVLYRSETTFNFSEHYPTLSTFSDTASLGDHCFMVAGNAIQTSIDPSQIEIVDSKYGVVPLPLPYVEDTVITLAEGPEWISSSLCAFATGLHTDPKRPSTLQVLGNLINSGEPLTVELAQAGTLTIRDCTGRTVAQTEATMSGRMDLATSTLHAGYYFISLSDRRGRALMTLPFVVQ